MQGGQWKTNIKDALSNEDWSALLQLARQEPARTLRYLTGRLSSADATSKWKAVRALSAVAEDREGMSEHRIRRLLQRFLWLLTDESGNVPFGIPEAFAEVLVARPEFQAEFLPLLCSLAYDPERIQTGTIEQGVFWALGRVGHPAAACSPEAVEAVIRAAQEHPEPETRSIATWARSRL